MTVHTQISSKEIKAQKSHHDSIVDLLSYIKNSPRQYIFFLYGVHGSELPGSRLVAKILASLVAQICPESKIKLIGPVAPWSSRHGFRFDRHLSDPNRICLSSETQENPQLTAYWNLWQQMRPDSRRSILNFLREAEQQELDLEALFQTAQTLYPGIPGYVHPRTQQRRLFFLKKIIKCYIHDLRISNIALIDVHTGVGLDACSHVFYHRTTSELKSNYLVDHLAAMLQDSCHIPCVPFITETGVLNNLSGMIDCLSELSYRTFGFNGGGHIQMQFIDERWINETKEFLFKAFAFN